MTIPTGLRAACAILIVLALSACNQESPRAATADATRVTTQAIQLQPWNDTLRALGTVKARESVTVTAKVSETVQEVHFDSGDQVKAGAPLVTLSGGQQQAALSEAKASADEAGSLYKRLAGLDKQQLIARSALDSQRATRDAANARVVQIRAQLSDRVIQAPFAGTLGLRQVSPGTLVTPGTAIVTLDDTQRVFVDFPVPETALSHLAIGQNLTANSASWPNQEFTGTVSTVDSRIDPATRAVMVRGEFSNDQRQLIPGMLMQVTLIRPERQALLVPEIAIVQIGNSSFVYRVRADNTVERSDVVIGGRGKGMAEVVTGLEPGDRIVIDGTGKLREGSAITVKAAGDKAAPGA